MEKIKAVQDLEMAQKRRVELQQVVSSAQLQYTSDDASRSRLTRATELCGVYSATIEEALVRIHQVDQALLPLATQIEQISEASGTGAPPDALGPPGF